MNVGAVRFSRMILDSGDRAIRGRCKGLRGEWYTIEKIVWKDDPSAAEDWARGRILEELRDLGMLDGKERGDG